MKTAYVIHEGVVVNAIVLEDDADPAEFGAVFGPDEAGIGWTFDGSNWTAPAEPEPSLEDLRAAKIAAITAAADALLSAGAPVDSGLHVALDDGSRADLTAMASTAIAAAAGSISWPDSYSQGWISVENTRIPLATPAAGLALAASVGNFYATIIQRRRNLKDAALAAVDEVELAAIDEITGWPG
ncbi:hypothetical protein KL86PLE_90742 [uncultured Pleomorphomonas sp.]|uniref:DUF4376 domain-containing protein n=1 Tax=uncultured Pleomorphomonas sp. TaxID=442121 RepID=A0A212LQV7_9HYPH|nr:hypothetical protein [uncultured Pleomorphomonas sp.]SCM79985.1 hypothetical protein KL86PLE_90742 [uncultured Pleomorphomonas sp.]